MLQMKDTGDYQKPFLPFFDVQALDPPITSKQSEKVSDKIFKEVEIALKQVRSSQNLNCNIKKTRMTTNILHKYIDYMEDVDCLRTKAKSQSALTMVKKELMKLVPEGYKISMLPSFFNNSDPERIGTVIRDTCTQFIIDTPKKVMFSIGVKVFTYNHSINSVRVVLVKLHQFEGAANVEADEEEKNDDGASKAKSQKGSKDEKEPQDVPPKK